MLIKASKVLTACFEIVGLSITSLTAIAAPSFAASSSSKQKVDAAREIEETVSATLEFTSTRNGRVYFDVENAEAVGAEPSVIEIGRLLNQYSASQASPSGNIATRAGMPIWGNWCGPGHGGGIAVDTLDSLCRTHDKCYGSRGYFACSCDRALVSGIQKNAYKMGAKQRAMASAVSVYFTYSFCNPFK
ncbi:hypothetical protein QMQ05_01175 [Glutamicibacter ectropisis]|uniref:Phospholipase A2 domain-containing protein n=1 Tax=Glutamicibacter ectropisis TaxID=3046593 RepID=A0AAU6WES9_9MICC